MAEPDSSLDGAPDVDTPRHGGLQALRAGLGSWIDLRLSVVLALLLGLALPQMYFAAQDHRGAEARALQYLQADLDQMTDILAAAMRDPLWQISPELGRPILQAMFRDERLVAVVVHEASSEAPFLDIYRSVSATAPAQTRSRSIMFEGRELGSIRVTMSAGPALARHQRELESFELRFWASTLGAVLLVLLVLQLRLVRPVDALLGRRRQPGRRPADDWRGAEELRPLVDEVARLERELAARRRDQ